MTDSKQKQEFAARLQRIHEKHGTPPPQPEAPRGGGKAGKSSIGNTLIWGLLAVMAGVGGYYGMVQLDTRTPAQSATAPAAQKPTEPKPQPQRKITDQGWSIPSPGIATADRAVLNLADISVGFDSEALPADPAALVPFAVNAECTLQKPHPSDVVYNVRMETGTLPTKTHVFSNKSLSDALIDHIEGVQTSPKHYKYGTRARGRMYAVDVFVTDTTAPVYLVLQSFRRNVIWNLQLAEGVTISHVAMIGENSGLVAPEEPVTYEALRISDFITDFEFGSNDRHRPCMIAPWRQPQQHWPAQAKANADNDLYSNQMYTYNSGYRRYDEWFQQVLGAPASTNVTDPHSAAHVLAGPLPDQPVPYRSMAGRDVYLSQNDFMVIGDDAFEDTHMSLLSMAVGGDPALLDPAPRRGPAQ